MAASVGGTDGLVVDKLDGAAVGRGVVGAAEGLMLGAIEWEYVGDEEGLAVIASLGCVLGLTEGVAMKTPDGISLVPTEGLNEGIDDNK